MELTIIFLLLASHWFCDFVLQSHWQATNKSKSLEALLSHTVLYSLAMFTIMAIYTMWSGDIVNMGACVYFFAITFICHTVTDYFTSKLNTYLWNKKDVHNFFVSVGFDQLLHFIQLFLTYKLLFV